MGPSQICGCFFREPRVFTIAHIYIYIYTYNEYMYIYSIYIYLYTYDHIWTPLQERTFSIWHIVLTSNQETCQAVSDYLAFLFGQSTGARQRVVTAVQKTGVMLKPLLEAAPIGISTLPVTTISIHFCTFWKRVKGRWKVSNSLATGEHSDAGQIRANPKVVK